MDATQRFSRKDLVVSKTLPTFVVSSPKTIISIFAVAAIFYAPYSAQAGNYGYQIPANCCTAKSVIVFGETGGDSLSYIHTASFHSQMPKTMKSLTADTRGVSASTANVRKRVTSICTPIERNIFQITMDLVAVHVDGAGLQRRCGVIHCDLYEAHNEDEALGLAVATVRQKYGAFHDIDIRSIKRERRYNLSAKPTL